MAYSSWNSFLQQSIQKYTTNPNANNNDDTDDGDEMTQLKQTETREYIGRGKDWQVGESFDGLSEFAKLYVKFLAKSASSVNQESKLAPTLEDLNVSVYFEEDGKNAYIVGKYVEIEKDSGSCDTIIALDTIKKIECLRLCEANVIHINLKHVKYAKTIEINSCEKLASFGSLALVDIHSLSILDCPTLYLFDAYNLMYARDICFNKCNNLTTLELPELAKVKSLVFNKIDKIQEFIFSKLKWAKTLRVSNCNLLNRIELAQLVECKSIVICENEHLEQLNLPMLKKVKNLVIRCNPRLKIINLPHFVHADKIIIEKCELLTTLNIGNLKCITKLFYLDDCQELKTFVPQFEWVKKAIISVNGQNHICTKMSESPGQSVHDIGNSDYKCNRNT